MRTPKAKVMDLATSSAPSGSSVRVGRIVDLNEKGQAVVDYPGNVLGPLVARSTMAVAEGRSDLDPRDRPVLLLFEDGDPALPIVVGFIGEKLLHPDDEKELVIPDDPLKEIALDGETLVFDAKKEIVLRCGKGSITLRADGKIVVKGTQLISRASGANKIKGARVNIN